MPEPGQVRDAPGDGKKQADQRHIGIAIGHCLRAHLQEPDYRQQGYQVPEPAHQEIGVPLPPADHQAGEDEQQHRRGRDR